MVTSTTWAALTSDVAAAAERTRLDASFSESETHHQSISFLFHLSFLSSFLFYFLLMTLNGKSGQQPHNNNTILHSETHSSKQQEMAFFVFFSSSTFLLSLQRQKHSKDLAVCDMNCTQGAANRHVQA
jgi:hypothetical protein